MERVWYESVEDLHVVQHVGFFCGGSLKVRLAWGNLVVQVRGFAAGCGFVRRVDVVVKGLDSFSNERVQSPVRS